MADEQNDYVRITLRVSPQMYDEIENSLSEDPDLRNRNELIRKAIRHYLLNIRENDLEQKAEKFLQAPIIGEAVTLRFQMPEETYRRIVWLARHREKVLPIDLMLRHINAGVQNVKSEDVLETTKLEEAYTRALMTDEKQRIKEANWVGR